MNDIAVLRGILADAFDRVADQVAGIACDLSEADAGYRPDADANSIAWLLWHLTRVQDDHVAGLADQEQVWTSEGFAERFGLPFDDAEHGYGHTSEQVAQVRTPPAELAAYHAAVHRATGRYLATITAAELERVVDTAWDPPVTCAVRLVSVIEDCTAHAGQAAYVKGLAGRRCERGRTG